jgi:hypothetical protein
MGNLIIQFVGICVHVDRLHFPELPSEHRVLFLANPTRLFIDPRNPNAAVDAHEPKLFLMKTTTIDLDCVRSNGAGDVFDLNRVALQLVKGNWKTPFEKDPTFDQVPRLTELGAGEGDRSVIVDAHQPVGACFDIDGGVLSACLNDGGAVITTLQVETFGPPKLRLKCIDRDAVTELEFQDEDPVRLTITNLAVGGEDNENDYLLDFRVCRGMPAEPRSPATPIGLSPCNGPADPRIADDFSTACSNSNYP